MNLDDIDAIEKEIIVVDDTIASLKLLSDILTGAGYRVRSTLDGSLALRSAQVKKPSLILLDIKLPGMDGYEVCRRLKANENTCSIPIIFISVLEDERDKVKGFEAGGVDYINKPFHSEEVLARVKTHLTLHIIQERLTAQNQRLAQEVAERMQAEEELRKARDELEIRVKERTTDLLEANAGLLREVGKRKQAEDALKDEARRKDDFIAMLGHELRNPLAPILYATDILKTTSFTDPLIVHAHDMISRQVNHLTKIVDDLLDTTRIAKGKITMRKESLDLAQLVRTVVEDFDQESKIRDIRVDTATPEDPVLISGDTTRIAQIAGNLISNALKFTNPGGRVMVRVQVGADLNHASLTVEDTGVGIAPDTLSRLFKPFAQADMDIARSRGGLGLGLALVKGLVELHGGNVYAESKGLGRGARFTIKLPLAKTGIKPESARGEEGEAPPKPSVSTSDKCLAPLKTLIIEDNDDVAESMRLLLKIKGFTAEIATDGASGLQYIKEHKPDAVLCDIGLPGDMDGYAIARTVRGDPDLASVYLIAITGYGQDKDKSRALKEGFDVHLTKPVSSRTLFSILESVHQNKKQ